MKLDATVMRTMEKTDFRLLEAVEEGMLSHSIVPMPLITSLAKLRHGGSHKIVSGLLRDKLLSHERKGGADGYRLTNAGYDVLALYNLKVRGFVAALGQKIGTGKESDIYLAVTPQGTQVVLKFHRLGRTSFRNIRAKRDYVQKPNIAHSWLFLSKISAQKEYRFMKALYNVQYSTPVPHAHNRHVVCMSLVRGVPLYQIRQMSTSQANSIYAQTMQMAERLALQHGLVHCDLNEFNLLVDLSGIQHTLDNGSDPYVRHSGHSVLSKSTETVGQLSKPAWEQSLEVGDNLIDISEPVQRLENGQPKPIVVLIDFPQMISTQHPNAQEYYQRDCTILKTFFHKKLRCDIDYENFASIKTVGGETNHHPQQQRLDTVLQASGVAHDASQHLELYYFPNGAVETGLEPFLENGNKDDDDDNDEKDNTEANQANDGSFEKAAAIAALDTTTEQPMIPLDQVEFETPAECLHDTGNDGSSLLGDDLSVLGVEELKRLTREELQELASKRVRQTMNLKKQQSKKQGAFRKRNRNKGKVNVSDSVF